LFPIGLLVIIRRYIVIKKSRSNIPAFLVKIRGLLKKNDVDSAINLCMESKTPTANIVKKGLKKIRFGHERVKEAIEAAGRQEINKLEKGLSILATIAGVAPLLGFLGTVTGMISAFMKIEDFMQFEASGKLNFEKLKEHLLLYSKNDGDIKVLLLSDGNYSNNEFDNFSNYIQESSQICIVPILIGADSSTDKLKTIAWNEHIYLAEDVLTAFKSLADISNNQYFFQLRCIQDILNISVKEKEDIVDEW